MILRRSEFERSDRENGERVGSLYSNELYPRVQLVPCYCGIVNAVTCR